MLSPALRRFLPYLRPHARLFALTVVAAAVSLAAAVTMPLLIKSVIDGPIAHRQPGQLVPIGLALIGLAAVEAIANFVRRNYSNLASLRMETELRNDFYAHLQDLQIAFHDNWQSGQLLSRAVADIQTVRRFVGFGLVFAAFFGAQWVLVLAVLLRLDWRLALLSALLLLPLIVVSNRFFRRYARIARRVQDQTGDLTTVVEEMATGVRIIKAFGRNGLLRDRFQRQASMLRDTNLAGVRVRASTWTTFNLLINLDLCAVLLVGGFAVAGSQLTIGGLVAFMTYLFMLIWPLDALGWILAMGEEATTASMRLREVFDSRPEIVDPPKPKLLTRVRGSISLEGVGFRYPEGGGWVLRGLDLTIEPGETVALVGATGSGKSTLISLLPRLHEPPPGTVAIDGVDIREIPLERLRGAIGLVPQEPFLFSATIAENVAFGGSAPADLKACATTTPMSPATTTPMRSAGLQPCLEQIQDAAAVARLDKDVAEFPRGFETTVGERGITLSGGQKQRTALARALFVDPKILVLDDALSAVDTYTEEEILSGLREVMRRRTSILVAHRISTVREADRIFVLEDGRIAEQGTHDQLVANNGLYAAMYRKQLLEEELQAS